MSGRRAVDRKVARVRLLRAVLAIGLAAAVAVVGGLYFLGRIGRDQPPPPVVDDGFAPTGPMVTVGEGFERTFTEGDRTVLSVRGDKYSVDRQGVVYLDQVGVVFHPEDGGRYEIEAGRARFRPDEREALLGGGVRLEGPDGMVLSTQRLQVGRGGKLLTTRGEVRYRVGRSYRGRADSLRARPGKQLYVLTGNVRLESFPEAETPFALDTHQLYLDRRRHLLRAERWAELESGGDRIEAAHLVAFYGEDERTPEFVRAREHVTARLTAATTGAEGGGVTEIETESLVLGYPPGAARPHRLDVEGGPGGKVLFVTRPAEGPRHRLTAPRIESFLDAGVPRRAVATGGVVLETLPDEGAERQRIRAGSAETTFGPEGRAAEAIFAGDVRFDQQGATDEAGETSGRGDRLVYDFAAERADLTGEPAVVEAPRGRFEAPRILYTRGDGIVHGKGGVRARLTDADRGALAGSPLAAAGEAGDAGPVRVEADEGLLRDQPRSFLFRGGVRAWRGDSLLVTETLRGDDAEGRLSATGGVRTRWLPAPAEDAAAGAEAEAGDGPIEATAETLTYERGERVLVYEGGVVAEQDRRSLTCATMRLLLAEEGGVETLRCTGDARLEDPEQGRTLAGERLTYRVAERTAEVVAAPGGKVSMKDAEGNVIEGPRMIYDVEADRVRVLGREGGDG